MWWEMAHRAPHPGLAPHVSAYCGYEERGAKPLRRREVANGNVTLIVSFGESIDVTMSASSQPARPFRSFVAGLHAGYAMTEHGGRQHGVEIGLTPLGAYRLLGVPMSAIANEVVSLDALRGREIELLADQLASAPGWDERMDLLDALLVRWMQDGPEPDRPVEWAWRQLVDSHGRVAVGDLADEIGWSRRHFATRFREQIGLAPKPTARVLRFRSAVDRLGRADGASIAEIAAEAGYADHSHLVREFRSLAGCTPTEMLAAQLPAAGGIAG